MPDLLNPRSPQKPEQDPIRTVGDEIYLSQGRKTRVLKNRNFLLLWIGQGTSMLGDQFFMIALPWLVLKLTGDPLALGTVLAFIGIPRALFMLVGGAVTDRYSPRLIMLGSDILRLGLISLLAVLVLFGWLELWMLYLLALGFGVISGFFIPASNTLVPAVVNGEELTVANSIYQGTTQLSIFVGPMLAGGLIGLFGPSKEASSSSQSVEMTGIVVALAVDGLTFVGSVVTLWMMKLEKAQKGELTNQPALLASIREGVGYVWQQPMLRTVFIWMVGANFLFSGPILVGIPVLANTRFSEGAAAFGIIMGGYGGGNLIGIVLAGSIIRILNKGLGLFFVGVTIIFALGLVLLGVVNSTPLAFMIMLVMGAGNGVMGVSGITFLQRQTPQDLLGRLMGLFFLASYGLVPISQALTGALLKFSLLWVYLGAGLLMLLVGVWLGLQPATKAFGQALVRQEVEGRREEETRP